MTRPNKMTWAMSVSGLMTLGGLGLAMVAAGLGIVLGLLSIFSHDLDELVEGIFWVSALSGIVGGIGTLSLIIGFIISAIRGPKRVPGSVPRRVRPTHPAPPTPPTAPPLP